MALLGAHMSIAGGISLSVDRGEKMKCEAIQIFVQSGRTWKIPPLEEQERVRFREAFSKAKYVKSVIAHNSYLLNLSTTNPQVRKRSVAYFVETMERCESLGIEGLVTHPGSHLGAGVEAGVKATSLSLKEVLRACSGFKSKIILENTAGQGGCIGHEFEQLRDIVEGTGAPDRIFFCFDTQHAFAAGYDLRTQEGYESTMGKFDSLLSLKRMAAFHLNDSLKEFNCHVDRHENIGKGFLGKDSFRPLVNDPRFKKVPMCIETYPGEDDELHRKDLKILRSLRTL